MLTNTLLSRHFIIYAWLQTHSPANWFKINTPLPHVLQISSTHKRTRIIHSFVHSLPFSIQFSLQFRGAQRHTEKLANTHTNTQHANISISLCTQFLCVPNEHRLFKQKHSMKRTNSFCHFPTTKTTTTEN